MENEYTELNRRLYSNPEVALGESNQFLDRLEAARAQGLDRIATTTHALGTDVPSYQGGLIGAGPSTVAQYQTPQVDQMVANLRATAQQQALNEQLNNLLAQKQQEYKDAYRNAYKTATTPAPSGDGDGTEFETNYTDQPDDMSVTYQPEGPNTLVPTGTDGYYIYQRQTGDSLDTEDRTYALRGINQAEAGILQGDLRLMNPSNNEIRTLNGKRYMYIQNDQMPNGAWFAIDVVDLGDTGYRAPVTQPQATSPLPLAPDAGIVRGF